MSVKLLMPDIVKIEVGFLRAQPEVVALLGHPSSVRGKLTPGTVYPAVKVTRITSVPIHAQPHIVESVRVQLDCYGGNNRQAERLAQTVRSVQIERMVGHASDGGLVTKVVPIRLDDMPDEQFEPVRERYVVEMEIWVKAAVL